MASCFNARSSQIIEMEAGMSQATAVVLNYIFHHPACSPDVGGLMLKDGSGNTVKLWFKLGIMLQDTRWCGGFEAMQPANFVCFGRIC